MRVQQTGIAVEVVPYLPDPILLRQRGSMSFEIEWLKSTRMRWIVRHNQYG